MIKFIYTGFFSLLFMGVMLVPSAHAESTSTNSMLEQIKVLMAKLEALQKQFADVRGDIREVLKDGLKEGMTDSDIKKIQELLATDSSIYPEGKVTGYYGAFTKEAVKRFQKRHELEVTGVINDETRELLEEYLDERFDGKIPAGLLRAPGIAKKIEDRFKARCEKKDDKHHGLLCKRLKDLKDDKDKDDDKDEVDDKKDFNVRVKFESSTTTLVKFTFEGKNYTADVDSRNITTVLDAVADEIDEDDTADDLDNALVKAIKEEFKEAEKNETTDSVEAEGDAEDAIDDAKDAIEDVQEEIDDESGDTSAAQTLLDKAQVKLDAAEDAFDDEDFEDAEELAEDAEKLAEDAEDKL